MADDDVVDRLLETWEEAFERGQMLTAESLAHDRPDLVNELAQRIEILRNFKPFEPSRLGGGRGTASLPPSPPKPINRQFRLEERLGDGGEGQVWKAFDKYSKRHVALKLPQVDGARLIEEAQRIAKLKHPHILTMYQTGIDPDGTAFVAYELMTGGTLADRIRDLGGRVPVEQALTWTTQIADALHALHAGGMVHRDVKPINILLAEDGRAVLADLGIAVDLATHPGGSTAGTSSYKAPEQIAGRRAEIQTDVFALALVVHEMLTGSLPPPGPSDQAAAERAIAIGGTRQVSPEVPARLRKVLEKGLSARLAERHDFAPEFARDLVRAWKGSARLRWAAAAAIAILGCVLAAVSWIRAEQRRAMAPSLQQRLAIAKTNMLHEQYAVAEAEYTEFLEAYPGNLEALRHRGFCRLNMGRLDAAVLDFDAVLAREPDDATTLRRRASAHGLLRDFPRAIADLDRAISLMPNATELPGELATIHAIRSHERFGEGDYAGAKADMDATIRLAPNSAINYSRRSACLFHLGDYDRALDDISEAIRREPSNAEFHEKRAMVLDKLGRPDEAEQDRQNARQLAK